MLNQASLLDIRQNKTKIWVIVYLLSLFILLMFFSFLNPNKVAAAFEDGQGYPVDVINRLNSYCSINMAAGPNASAQTTWLSLANDLDSNSANISPGESVQLRLNIVTKRCSSDNTVLIGDRFRPIQTFYIKNSSNFEIPELTGAPYNDLVVCPPDLPPKGSIIGCPPSSSGLNYSRESWSFTISSNGITPNASGFYDVPVIATTKQFSWRQVEPNFLCIQGAPQPSMDYEVETLGQDANDVMMSKCASTTVNYSIRLNFGPKLDITPTCDGIITTFSGSQADIYGPSGFLGSVVKSGNEFDLVSRGIASGTKLDVYARGKPKDTMKTYTWVKPSVCPFVLTPTGKVVLDDDEDPKKAYFSEIGAKNNIKIPVKDITITRKYYVIKGGSRVDLPDPDPTSAVFTVDFDGVSWPDTDERGVSGLVAGDQVCVDTSVTPGTGNTDASGNVSNPGAGVPYSACAPVVNKPYVSFYSNDLVAGYGFKDSGSTDCKLDDGNVSNRPDSLSYAGQILAYNKNDGGYKGSMGQIGIKALKSIDGVNSGATKLPTVPNILSFANTGSGIGTFGGEFGESGQCMHDYIGQYQDELDTPDYIGPIPIRNSFPNTPGKTQRVTVKGDLLFERTSKIPKGSKWTFVVDGNVVIKNNIEFESPTSWADKSEIPSFYLIVRGNISIASTVSRLDGVYIAQPEQGTYGDPVSTGDPVSGRIFTCTDLSGSKYPLTSIASACNNQLTVYGSFIAQRIHLDRTKNSIRNSNPGEIFSSSKAAEIFISSPETFLTDPNLIPSVGEETKDDYFTTLPPIL